MATERRLIRPYEGVRVVQDVLERWIFKVGEEQWLSGSTVVMSEDGSDALEPVVTFDGDDDDFEAARDELRTAFSAIGLNGEDVGFGILTTSPRLKLTDVIHWGAVGAQIEIPREIVVSRPSSRALETPRGGCTVEVALSLTRDVEPENEYPLRPTRKGTWLARTTLALRAPHERAGFPVHPLTPEARSVSRARR